MNVNEPIKVCDISFLLKERSKQEKPRTFLTILNYEKWSTHDHKINPDPVVEGGNSK